MLLLSKPQRLVCRALGALRWEKRAGSALKNDGKKRERANEHEDLMAPARALEVEEGVNQKLQANVPQGMVPILLRRSKLMV